MEERRRRSFANFRQICFDFSYFFNKNKQARTLDSIVMTYIVNEAPLGVIGIRGILGKIYRNTGY